MKRSSSSQWYCGTQLYKQPTIKYILVATKGILPQTLRHLVIFFTEGCPIKYNPPALQVL